MNGETEYCKNCGEHLLSGQNYCPICGQATDTHRINFHFLIHELQHSIFHVDAGILYTIKQLLLRPGYTLREYLEGKRKQHFKPVLFIMIIGSLCGFVNYFLKDSHEDKQSVNINSSASSEVKEVSKYIDLQGIVNYFEGIIKWFSEHLAFTILMLIPVFSFGFYLGFKKYKINYTEWLVIMCFIAGQSLVLYLFFLFLNSLSSVFEIIYMIIISAMLYWTMLQMFYKFKKSKVILRTTFSIFLVFIFACIFVIILSLIIGGIGLLLYGNKNLLNV